jgi:glycosyltransferase involved in cell wall biosynthesis
VRHLGLNAVFLDPGRMGGLETYLHALVPGIAAARPGLRITVFCNPGAADALRGAPWADRVELVTHRAFGLPGGRALAEVTVLPVLAARRGVDLLHSLGMTAPLRTRGASVITVGDVIWHHHPDTVDRRTLAIWKQLIPRAARAADRIHTFTEASRDELTRILRVPADRIDVIAPGGGLPVVAAGPDPGLGAPLVLTVSAKRSHKNLVVLLEAVAQVPGAVLALPGNPTDHERDVLRPAAERLGIADRVRFLGRVEAAELEALYAAADVFCFPSAMEGFGLPVVEAMRRGVPVVASDTAALTEVGGDAARYFPARDAAACATALRELLGDAQLRAELAARGRERADRFTDARMVEQTLASYDRALAERRPPLRAGQSAHR